MSREAILFIAIGGAAALVNVLARALFNLIVPFELAVVLAFPIALTLAFVLNRTYVFRTEVTHEEMRSQYMRFAVVNLVSLGLVWIISVGLARVVFPAIAFTWHSDDIAHFIGVAAPAMSSYFAHRAYTFSPKNR